MKSTADNLAQRLLELRQSFDGSFARPLAAAAAAPQKLLSIRTGGHKIMLRLDEVAGIHACPRLVPLPAPRPALLGIAGVRGRVLVVYNLAALLGEDAAFAEAPRWLLVPRLCEQLALAVHAIEAFVQVAADALHPIAMPDADALCTEVLHEREVGRPVLSTERLLAVLRRGLDPSADPALWVPPLSVPPAAPAKES